MAYPDAVKPNYGKAAIAAAIADIAAAAAAIAPLGLTAGVAYDATDTQALIDKLDELIAALAAL